MNEQDVADAGGAPWDAAFDPTSRSRHRAAAEPIEGDGSERVVTEACDEADRDAEGCKIVGEDGRGTTKSRKGRKSLAPSTAPGGMTSGARREPGRVTAPPAIS